MPKSRRSPSILEVALKGEWTLSALLCGLFAILGVLVLPAILSSNAAFHPLAGTVRKLALIPTVGFGLLATFKFFRAAGRSGVRRDGRRPQSTADASPAPWQAAHDRANGPSRTPQRDAPSSVKPTTWSLPLLQSIEWKRFEEVVAAYFRAKNFRCETVAYGADGGVDGRLYFGDLPTPVGIVQCKAWSTRLVGVAQLRELRGVMAHEKIDRGYFCATGEFSQDAIAFAAANPIKLISGRDLLAAIALMPAEDQQRLLTVSTTGDYTTPTCASCGIKMVERTIGGKAAWGCRNYPRCRIRIFRKADR